MSGIKDLFAGERGLFAFTLIIAATVLAAMSLMTIPEWRDFSRDVFGIFVGGKTITTSIGLIATKGAPVAVEVVPTPPTPPAPPAPLATPATPPPVPA